MEEAYVAVDCGKYATKVATYDKEKDTVSRFSFLTRSSAGNFEDDSLEKKTFILQIGDDVYKVGKGAMYEAELETTKATQIHKNCTLAAIAMCLPTTKEFIPVNVAIGIPAKEWIIVEKRQLLQKYLLPDGDISIKLKTTSDKPVVEKHFCIKTSYVLAESVGALFLDKMSEYEGCSAGVIDIGNLNINGSMWDDFDLNKKDTFTDELGGNILISGLTQELSAEFSRCSEDYVAKLLTQNHENRMLKRNGIEDKELEETSQKLIDNYLLNHVKQIRRRVDAKSWPVDFMPLCFIGGTSDLLRKEIYEVFGERVYIPESPEFANVIGFLRILCGRILKKSIPTTVSTHEADGKEENVNKAEQKTA